MASSTLCEGGLYRFSMIMRGITVDVKALGRMSLSRDLKLLSGISLLSESTARSQNLYCDVVAYTPGHVHRVHHSVCGCRAVRWKSSDKKVWYISPDTRRYDFLIRYSTARRANWAHCICVWSFSVSILVSNSSHFPRPKLKAYWKKSFRMVCSEGYLAPALGSWLFS